MALHNTVYSKPTITATITTITACQFLATKPPQGGSLFICENWPHRVCGSGAAGVFLKVIGPLLHKIRQSEDREICTKRSPDIADWPMDLRLFNFDMVADRWGSESKRWTTVGHQREFPFISWPMHPLQHVDELGTNPPKLGKFSMQKFTPKICGSGAVRLSAKTVGPLLRNIG